MGAIVEGRECRDAHGARIAARSPRMLSHRVRHWFARARAAVHRLAGIVRPSADDELTEEMEFHVAKATERNIRLGMSPDDARRAALVTFGGRTQWTEATRDEQRSQWLDDLTRDIRHASGALRRNPGFAVSAMVTIAVG